MAENFTLKKIFPGLPETERGRPYVLKADPKGKKFLYTIGSSVIIRDIDNPSVSEIITHHAKKATVACYSPSGFYISSGDASGTLKIWDTVNPEHIIKYEYRPISSAVYDIAWSDDSKRIVAVGDGREKYGFVFSWDSGSSVGDIGGHTKSILSVDLKQTRPFAIVTGGEDMTMVHYKGPPFKYTQTIREHTNFVNCVRFSPDGTLVASCGLDGRIYIFDGNTLEKKFELQSSDNKAHSGGIYSICWSPCSKRLLSVSGDKTCKIWNVEEAKCQTVFEMGTDVGSQQLGCLWMKDNIITVALSGALTFLDENNPAKPKKVYWGHNKGIICMTIDKEKKTLVTGSYDGILNRWDISTGVCTAFSGEKMSAQVSCVSLSSDLVTIGGVGNVIKFGSFSSGQLCTGTLDSKSEPLCACGVNDDIALVGTINSIIILDKKAVVSSINTTYQVTCIAVDSKASVCAVGGSDKKIRLFQLVGSKLEPMPNKEFTIDTPLTHLVFSNNDAKLLATTNSKYVHVFDMVNYKEERYWAAHTNRVNWGDWSQDNDHIATCGVDGSVNIWKLSNRDFRIEIRGAHRIYNCVRVLWLTNNTVVSVGQQDCTIKFWELKL